MKKEYHIRIYITSEGIGLILNDMIDSGLLVLTNSFDGKGGIIAIYDGKVSRKALKFLISLHILYLPLNHYEDFKLTCPSCGGKVYDDMFLQVYDENLLSGYNIVCEECGTQMAEVEFLLD